MRTDTADLGLKHVYSGQKGFTGKKNNQKTHSLSCRYRRKEKNYTENAVLKFDNAYS